MLGRLYIKNNKDFKIEYKINDKEKIDKFQILYGGSVNSSNFREINSIDKINGALIGGASLKIDEMNKILTSC